MEGAHEFLEAVRQQQLIKGHFRGLIHALVGRRISRDDGSVISAGLTWRQVSELLKTMRWDRDWVKELGLEPDDLPPRDRQRFWYSAIVAAGIDTPQAAAAADQLAERVKPLGYTISNSSR